ncbi:DUF4405 domain-containing protein [Mariniflexile sp.]|uniref:DUF4405 domain-containing protein n=1 Tax=Mariniflexile sp. TaxID=1979402 RepID=UPI00356AC71A
MKKPVLNFVINTIMALTMAGIIGIGFLIEFTLISGQKRKLLFGENVELYFMGMNRHEWGSIHLILGYIIIGLLFVHIFLHWNIVKSVYKKIIHRPLLNKLIGFFFAFICLVLILLPLFIKPEIKTTKNGSHEKFKIEHLKK